MIPTLQALLPQCFAAWTKTKPAGAEHRLIPIAADPDLGKKARRARFLPV